MRRYMLRSIPVILNIWEFILPLFVSRSMYAFFIDLLGPLHWLSKRQAVTATSSAKAEMYATNECVKLLLELVQILDFLGVREVFMPGTTNIFNDNKACVNWSCSCTTKGLQHIQMKENHIRENILSGFVSISHIDGKINLADLFTKEMKDTSRFVEICYAYSVAFEGGVGISPNTVTLLHSHTSSLFQITLKVFRVSFFCCSLLDCQ